VARRAIDEELAPQAEAKGPSPSLSIMRSGAICSIIGNLRLI
jgi:hypothetical protein